MTTQERRFEVALSFPGERRTFVSQVADKLSEQLGQQRVFYDNYYEAELARPDLDLYLGRLYRDDSELVVPFYCADYERKRWCKLEWRQMRDILFNLEEYRIMPFRFDDTPIPGVLSIDGYVNIENRSPEEVAELILKRLAVNKARPGSARPPGAPGTPPSEQPEVSIARLPVTGEHFFGRDDEVAFLDAAWSAELGSTFTLRDSRFTYHASRATVLSIVAWGGVGKSALVNAWLGSMAHDRWRGAERVFAWTFYSQGTRDTAASADEFIARGLKWFGDPDPAAGSAWDKGERLAKLVRRQRTLLLLDGLEPLQHPPHAAEPGRITDPALATLVRELALENPGLCVITTRETVADLAGARRATTAQLDLTHLSTDAGVALLREMGVEGTDDERRQLVQDVRGHALTLSLLGKYLVQAHGGDIRKREEVRFIEADAEVQGGHAFRVMEAYERWFARPSPAESREEGRREGIPAKEGWWQRLLGRKGARPRLQPEIAILRLLGFFDRPADAGCLAALRREPPIPDLTDSLVDLTEAQWNLAISRLASCGLVSSPSDKSAIPNQQSAIDSHPLVREHFGAQVRTRFPAAWKEGHNRLYEHLKQAAPDLPGTLEEMMPLFAAVAHGCLAGRYQEACDEVYWRRIQRGAESFNTHKLGAIGAELAALSGFFEHLWDKPEASLKEAPQAWLLDEAGFDLRALGRLAEAVPPFQAGLEIRLRREEWVNAARFGGNLSELSLTLGAVGGAERYARPGVDLADRSGDAFRRVVARTTLADALHQAGRLQEAEAAFREAEAMQKAGQPEYPLLYSLRGYQYCDLLLTRGGFGLRLMPAGNRVREGESESAIETCRDVQKRVEQTIKIAERNRWLLDIALDHLSLGRAFLLEHVLTPEARSLDPAVEHLNAAVDGLRQAGHQEFIACGLLARAPLRRLSGDASAAAHDLAEARELADRSGMKLFQVDGLIEQACQLIADCGVQIVDSKDKARECVAQAKALIESTGYHRRDPEIRHLEQILA